MIVVVLTAIYVVGIFLLWDYFNVNDTLDDILDHKLYGKDIAPASKTAVNVTVTGKSITEDEELLLTEYFRWFYAGLGARSPEEMEQFYTNQCEYELFDTMAYEYETYLASLCPLDLSFDECTVALNITRRHPVNRSNKVEIDLELSAVMTLNGTGKRSTVRGEKHSFTTEESGKSPLVLIHETERFARAAADSVLDGILAASRLTRKDLTYSYYPKYTSAALEKLKAEAADIMKGAGGNSESGSPEYGYDRETAANTALSGFSDDGNFKRFAENDANYISRCIFAGGIPMDCQGDSGDQWKWYDSELNNERKKTGCSQSWFEREAFYIYVTTNEGFGLVGGEVGHGEGKIGDVIQLMSDGKPTAEFMITNVVSKKDGTVLDYLVSNDRYTAVSLLTLGFSDFRVLHIEGYNTANI